MATRSRLRNVSFAIACLVIGFFLAEGLVRVFGCFGGAVGSELAKRDPLMTRVVPHGDFGYKQRAGYSHFYSNGTQASWNSMAYRGPEVEEVKPDGVYRIVLLGGSTTHGFGVDDHETIDAHMRAILSDRYPNRRFEVVNLAMGGYDSYQLYERMRSDGVRLSPDLLIINSGINDVSNSKFRDIEPADPRTLLWREVMQRLRDEAKAGGPSFWMRVKHYSYLARLPGFIRSRMTIRPRIEGTRRVTPYPDAIEYFADNIAETAKLGRSIGSDLIFSTPASSLATMYAPDDVSTRAYWINDASTTQAYRERLAERLRELASAFTEDGHPVPYVSLDLPPDHFIDDCHLTGDGNRAAARAFSDALEPFL